ncbi:hypothetical protein RFI_14435 [Reticulomyxa filosa]|uniref:SPRY domain-containing protein n=1 Tax=Reticulomyxa filosa TaxID=46433 RepID=X6NBQ7_RETFI|nr:hypothetical protein RFI_14435 [Reticulomyxa filosa]|eukprot:ETO22757.1 hypothetical protein RFI_14435 [Reticulomyxa filosa]
MECLKKKDKSQSSISFVATNENERVYPKDNLMKKHSEWCQLQQELEYELSQMTESSEYYQQQQASIASIFDQLIASLTAKKMDCLKQWEESLLRHRRMLQEQIDQTRVHINTLHGAIEAANHSVKADTTKYETEAKLENKTQLETMIDEMHNSLSKMTHYSKEVSFTYDKRVYMQLLEIVQNFGVVSVVNKTTQDNKLLSNETDKWTLPDGRSLPPALSSVTSNSKLSTPRSESTKEITSMFPNAKTSVRRDIMHISKSTPLSSEKETNDLLDLRFFWKAKTACYECESRRGNSFKSNQRYKHGSIIFVTHIYVLSTIEFMVATQSFLFSYTLFESNKQYKTCIQVQALPEVYPFRYFADRDGIKLTNNHCRIRGDNRSTAHCSRLTNLCIIKEGFNSGRHLFKIKCRSKCPNLSNQIGFLTNPNCVVMTSCASSLHLSQSPEIGLSYYLMSNGRLYHYNGFENQRYCYMEKTSLDGSPTYSPVEQKQQITPTNSSEINSPLMQTCREHFAEIKWQNGDTLVFLLDLDNKQITFYVNHFLVGTVKTILTSFSYYLAICCCSKISHCDYECIK